MALHLGLVATGLIGVVMALWYYRRRYMRRNAERTPKEKNVYLKNAEIPLPLHSKGGDEVKRTNEGNKMKMIQKPPCELDAFLLKILVDFNDIQFTRKLNEGAVGEVWLGLFQGDLIAIKQIHQERKTDIKEIECFVEEVKVMANLQHPHIVNLLGFSWNPLDGNPCALSEYMENGNLFDYLQRLEAPLTWTHDKIGIAIAIAQAILHLHTLQVIHRHLTSKNVLLDATCTAKLSNFGISRVRDFDETMAAGVGTALWAAPELFLAKKYTDKADIYSFGVMLSELDTCAIPFADQAVGKHRKLNAMAIIKLVTQQQAKPTFSPSCPDAVRALAFQCLDYDPAKRPSAAQVVEMLKCLPSHPSSA